MLRIQHVEPLEGFKVRLHLTDGQVRETDLEVYLDGPIFQEIRENPEVFRTVRVDAELGTIVWPNGADICPDVLIHGRTPAASETHSSEEPAA